LQIVKTTLIISYHEWLKIEFIEKYKQDHTTTYLTVAFPMQYNPFLARDKATHTRFSILKNPIFP